LLTINSTIKKDKKMNPKAVTFAQAPIIAVDISKNQAQNILQNSIAQLPNLASTVVAPSKVNSGQYAFTFGDMTKIQEIWVGDSDIGFKRKFVPLDIKNPDHVKETKRAKNNSDAFIRGQHLFPTSTMLELGNQLGSVTEQALIFAKNNPIKAGLAIISAPSNLQASIIKSALLTPTEVLKLGTYIAEISTYMMKHPKEATKSWLCKPYNQAKALMAKGQYELAGCVYTAGILGQIIAAGGVGTGAGAVLTKIPVKILVSEGWTALKKSPKTLQRLRPIKLVRVAAAGRIDTAIKMNIGYADNFVISMRAKKEAQFLAQRKGKELGYGYTRKLRQLEDFGNSLLLQRSQVARLNKIGSSLDLHHDYKNLSHYIFERLWIEKIPGNEARYIVSQMLKTTPKTFFTEWESTLGPRGLSFMLNCAKVDYIKLDQVRRKMKLNILQIETIFHAAERNKPFIIKGIDITKINGLFRYEVPYTY
jgi:hypothetical protein